MGKKRKLDPESEAALSAAGAQRTPGGTDRSGRERLIAGAHLMIGRIQAMDAVRKFGDVASLVWLRQVKEAKAYRDVPGVGTWEKFCEMAGLKRRTVDENLQNLAAFGEEFLATVAGLGLGYRDLRKLRRLSGSGSFSIEDDVITIAGSGIPLAPEYREDIQAALEALCEEKDRALQDREAELRAERRIVRSKEDVIRKMERALGRLEKTAGPEDLTEEEAEGLAVLERVQEDFLRGIASIRRNVPYAGSPVLVLRRLYFLYIFFSKVSMEERLALNEAFAEAEDVPWEITEGELPPEGVLEAETPLTAGLRKNKGNGRG